MQKPDAHTTLLSMSTPAKPRREDDMDNPLRRSRNAREMARRVRQSVHLTDLVAHGEYLERKRAEFAARKDADAARQMACDLRESLRQRALREKGVWRTPPVERGTIS